jgi:hypothetical protein
MADIDEQKLAKELSRAQEARRLLDHPLLKEAFETEEKTVLEALAQCHDTEQILKLHRAFVWGRRMKDRLQTHIETGKLAAFQLEEKRKFKLWRNNG